MSEYRLERDFLGEVRVPREAYYGVQTQRAVENFPISGIRFGRHFLRALGNIKAAAGEINMELKLLDGKIGKAMVQAAIEVAEGKLDSHFPLDIYQTGSGTSTNMNANEVIANRANEILGHPLGSKGPVHPNDHVNMAQSSNDVFPTAIHIAALEAIHGELIPALKGLHEAMEAKAREFWPIVKAGRTHLQDAVPIRLGQEFSGYASQVRHGIRAIEATLQHLSELAVGGTAVGTGLNTHPDFPRKVVERLSRATGLALREAPNHFEAQGAQDALVETSGALRLVAVSLMKIANDLRILSSGPRAGIAEIVVPTVQPGSSIMPGKVNPVIPEMVNQVAAQVIGNDAAIAIGGQTPGLDLNTMMPVMHHNLQQSIVILANASRVFAERCVRGIAANEATCRRYAEMSTALVTKLNPIIGYERAAEIAKESERTGIPIKELVVRKGVLKQEEADRLLDPASLTEPSRDTIGGGGG